MLQTTRSYRGMVTAPHHLAAQAGLSILAEGGNAIEATIAAAAVIAVVYPHMNSIGGDGIWIIGRPGETPVIIQACGRSAGGIDRNWYRERGYSSVPTRGPLSALTVAGTVDGWRKAQELSLARHDGRMPMSRLLDDAVTYAQDGVPVPTTLNVAATKKLAELCDVSGFADAFMEDGAPLPVGARLRQAKLARTLRRLAEAGLDDFYRGDIARSMASDLERAGCPLTLEDLEACRATFVKPLALNVSGHTVYNAPPPTQGLASLLILGLYARNPSAEADDDHYIHRLVESTKAAFRVRNRHIADPDHMSCRADDFLTEASFAELDAGISLDKAAPWPDPPAEGDTVWLSAADETGLIVSFIQSIYWEFGSGVVLPETGVLWQNRGTSFDLEDTANMLRPNSLPFSTIQPAMAALEDGRLMAYGTMGGEGQPQTQAAVFTRYAMHDQELQSAVTAPRWLLGRMWGEDTTTLKIESRFNADVIEDMRRRDHDVQVVGAFEEFMGHAGAIVRHPDGLLEGAADPRSDGGVAAR